jgi:hypothetical protein
MEGQYGRQLQEIMKANTTSNTKNASSQGHHKTDQRCQFPRMLTSAPRSDPQG